MGKHESPSLPHPFAAFRRKGGRGLVSGRDFSRAENAGCPTFATSLFLSLRWESTDLNPPLSTQHKRPVPHPFRGFCEKGGTARTLTRLLSTQLKKWVPHISILRCGIARTQTHLSQLTTTRGAPHLDSEMWESTNPRLRGNRTASALAEKCVVRHEVSGHDFSCAENAAKEMRASAPEGRFLCRCAFPKRLSNSLHHRQPRNSLELPRASTSRPMTPNLLSASDSAIWHESSRSLLRCALHGICDL